MYVDLLTHLDELGFGVKTPFTYSVQGGVVNIATTGTIELIIDGATDFCVTNIWVIAKNAGVEGFDFIMRDIRNNVEFQNRIMPLDTGTATRPKVPYQTIQGEPSMLSLPWIIPAGSVLQFSLYARYAATQYFDVVLEGYKLNTRGANVPWKPFVYLFNGNVDDLAANTYNVFQEVTINGPSDFICTLISSNWDRSAVNVDVRETLTDAGNGFVYFRKQIEGDRLLPRPYNDSFETTLPVPLVMPNGTVLRRQVSNYGTVAERRPELFVFGYFDTRTEEQKKRSSFNVQ